VTIYTSVTAISEQAANARFYLRYCSFDHTALHTAYNRVLVLPVFWHEQVQRKDLDVQKGLAEVCSIHVIHFYHDILH
jgi:hypothetical protein